MSTSPINVSSLLQAFGLNSASNIDVNTIVNELMQVNEQPLVTLQSAVTTDQTDISAYGTILSNLSNLQSSVAAMQNSTTGMSATPSDSSYFTATASNTATTGTTAIDISNIASAQSLYSTAFGSKSSPVADLSGSGNATQYLQIDSGSNKATITVNSSNNTLSGIASAINSANSGVTATVIQQSSDFVIGSTNNTINFNYGSYTNLSATISKGDYSGSQLASAMESAMNSAVDTAEGGGSTDTPFTASYSSSNAFSITNTNSSNSAQINWASSTLTPQLLGFMPDSGTDSYSSTDPGTESSAIAASGSSGSTITGTAVNGMYALSLVSKSTGVANEITVKVDENSSGFIADSGYIGETGSNKDMFGLSVLASDATFGSTNNVLTGFSNLTQTSAAADAQLTIAGVPITSSSNTVTTAVPGVTLNLLSAGSGSLDVTADSSSLANELSSLVSAYNTAMTTINTYSQPATDTSSASSSSEQGLLSGDNILLTLSNTLMNVTTNPYGTESSFANDSLAYIGVTHTNAGVLQFNATQLSTAYQTDSANITTMINNMANSFGAALNNYIETTIPAEQSGYQTQVTSTQIQENELAMQLVDEQTELTTEYSALSNLVTNDNQISNYLTEETDQQDKSSTS